MLFDTITGNLLRSVVNTGYYSGIIEPQALFLDDTNNLVAALTLSDNWTIISIKLEVSSTDVTTNWIV